MIYCPCCARPAIAFVFSQFFHKYISVSNVFILGFPDYFWCYHCGKIPSNL